MSTAHLRHAPYLNLITLLMLLARMSSTTILPNEALYHPQDGHHRSQWVRHALIDQGPRQEHSVAAVGNDVYIVGGVDYNDASQLRTINRVELYNVPTDRWHVAAPLPQPLNHANAAGVGGKLYLLGALSGGMDWIGLPDSYVYNPFNDTWMSITPMPNGTARGSSAVGVYKSTVFLAGGMTLLRPYPPGEQNCLWIVSSYDTVTDSWKTDYPPLPAPRQHVGGAVVNGTFYVIGGRENDINQYHNTVFALDLENPTSWKTLAPMPTARGSVACSARGFRIYCFGGEGNPDNPQRIFNNTEVYDTETDSWTKLAPMEVPRHGTGAATVGDAIYIPGGGVTTAAYPVGILDSFTAGFD